MDTNVKGDGSGDGSCENPWYREELCNIKWDAKLRELNKHDQIDLNSALHGCCKLPLLKAGLLRSFSQFNFAYGEDRWKRLCKVLRDAYVTHDTLILEDTVDEQVKLEVLLFSDAYPECRQKLSRGLVSQVWLNNTPKSIPWYSKTMQLVRDIDACCFFKRLIDARSMINCEPLILPYNKIDKAVEGFLNKDYEEETSWSPYIEADFIYKLFYEGFITIATSVSISGRKKVLLIPKLHIERSCLQPLDIIMQRRGINAAKYLTVTVDKAFHKVVSGITKQHGENWLYPEVQNAFNRMHYQRHRCHNGQTKIHSIEVWKGDELVAGEIGVVTGAVYTSVTGFHTLPSSGTFQIYALAAILHFQGFEMWDLGMDIAYKRHMGAKIITRDEFVMLFNQAKTKERVVEIPALFQNSNGSTQMIDALRNEQKKKLSGS